jgi:hypothetical protein
MTKARTSSSTIILRIQTPCQKRAAWQLKRFRQAFLTKPEIQLVKVS